MGVAGHKNLKQKCSSKVQGNILEPDSATISSFGRFAHMLQPKKSLPPFSAVRGPLHGKRVDHRGTGFYPCVSLSIAALGPIYRPGRGCLWLSELLAPHHTLNWRGMDVFLLP